MFLCQREQGEQLLLPFSSSLSLNYVALILNFYPFLLYKCLRWLLIRNYIINDIILIIVFIEKAHITEQPLLKL